MECPPLAEKVEFQWAPLVQQAFFKLKEGLTTDRVLAYSEFGKPRLVATIASSVVRSVLPQLDGNVREHPMNYENRSSKKAESIT